MLLLLLLLQTDILIDKPSQDSAVISSTFTLRPSAAAADAAAAAARGAGVGEFGGAHWFAQQEGATTATAADPAAAAAADNDGPEGQIQISSVLTVTSSGVITVTWEVDATEALPAQLPLGLKPSLPRVGLHALLPHTIESVTWYGLGPHECYPDRKASGLLQQHTM
jgi:beta-galactosidase